MKFAKRCKVLAGLLIALLCWGNVSANADNKTQETYLYDAQKLLDPEFSADLEAFLEHHARESEIDLEVYVNRSVPHQQAFDSSAQKEKPTEERRRSTGATKIQYYLETPEKSTIQIGSAYEKSVASQHFNQCLESAILASSSESLPHKKMEAFFIQLSIRIYWLERIIHGTADRTYESMPEGEKLRIFPKKNQKPLKKTLQIDWIMLGGGAAILCISTLSLAYLLISWRNKGVYLFPISYKDPRLGADHAAGIGAVISFSNPDTSPSQQKKDRSKV